MAIMFVATLAYTGYMTVKNSKAIREASQAPEPEDFQATRAEAGSTIPVVFGTCWLGQNVVWYGDVTDEAIKTKQGKKG